MCVDIYIITTECKIYILQAIMKNVYSNKNKVYLFNNVKVECALL